MVAKSLNIQEIRAQLDLLTSKLKEYEWEAERSGASRSNLLLDGLRLSQEVEILQKQNLALQSDNECLRRELAFLKENQTQLLE